MDDNFKKLIKSTQPESLSTIRLCKRLGYHPEDLIYKSIDEFQSVNHEMRQMKYDNYKAKVLKIINEINNVRCRNKTTGVSELSSQPLVQLSSIGDNVKEQSQSISVKERVLQNLIQQELLRQKRFAQSYQQNNKIQEHKTKLATQPSQKISIKSKESTQLMKREQSNRRCETHREFETKEKSLAKSNQKVLINRQHILKKEQHQQDEYMKKLEEKGNYVFIIEKKAIERIEQYKSELKQNQQKSQFGEVKNKKEQLDNEQYQLLINRQYEKLQRLRLKQTQLEKPTKKQMLIRNKTQSLIFDSDLESRMDQKIERVVNMKSQMLSERSKIADERLRINQNDVNFNKYHDQQLRIREECKRIGLIERKQKQNTYQIDTRYQVLEKQKKVSVWEQVNRVSHLFSSPIEYDKYRTQMKLLLNKQRETLEMKNRNRIDILYKLLPQQMAEKVLQ
ncbi:unnamed protein product (macronuclear) [Paramecium tetraurelia]|uniref:Uncharacterized protein n=1 Tax=Paramecium tetraurelia TaxID=5888 RepID=A0CD06_PARTE|nr:uncharacterized protein GSPATT00037458001 [Paramecium tetraurelia]CAK68673.1 unnamed protein product [Paramecium tetraurelia]|eukprot:XP_001436070.1 hypothetical protein (macronuclear) [Paramecium tetraurelia strain d4-2]